MSEPTPPPDTPLETPVSSGSEIPSQLTGAWTGILSLREPPGDDTPTPPSGCAGRNLLFGEIGRGGMGNVFLGRDPALGRDLAVKVLRQEHRDNLELVRRFLEEAQIGGQLQHPGVVPVYELGRFDNDRPFFTMKLVKGQTLAQLLSQRTAPSDDLPRFLGIFEQVCQTVAYAHARGVIHRDLKPANVMVGTFGEVQVMDWGMAKVLPAGGVADESSPTPDERTVIKTARSDSGADVSQAGTVLGTPAFMPPEQANGEVDKLDERADVFGLGAILCTILTGKPPYLGRDSGELHRKAMRGDLGECFTRLDGCGADTDLIALGKECLAAERDDRPRHAGEVARWLAAYQAGVQQRLRHAELERAAAQARAAEERKRRKLAVALAAAVLALVAVGSLSGLYVQRQASRIALQEAEQRREVESALDRAAGLREKARWSEARLVLEQARERRGASVPDALRQQLEQALRDLALVDRLETIRQRRSVIVADEFDKATALQDNAAVFQEAGLGQVGDEAAAVAARIGNSAIKGQLVSALDDWASIADQRRDWEWLLEIGRRADRDEWRDRFRDGKAWRDRAALQGLADELLRDKAKLPPQSPQLLAVVGQTLYSLKGDALPLLTEARRRYPGDFWINFILGNALYAARKWEAAAGSYRAALAVRPETVVVYNNLGNTLKAKGDLAEAIQEYREALRLDPGYATGHYNLGIALKDKGERDEAIKEYREAIRLLDPAMAAAHYNIALILQEQGKLDEAIQEYRAAIRLDPTHAHPHNNLGNALRAKGEPDEAIKEYREAIRLDPKYPQPHNGLAAVLHEQGKPDEAIQEFREAIRIDPKYLSPHFNLGFALDLKGEYEEALQEFREVLRLDPKLAPGHLALAKGLLAQGHFAQARDATRRCLELLSERAPLRPSALQQLQQCEQLLPLEEKLPDLLAGKQKPVDHAECLALAAFCAGPKRLTVAAVRFYEAAFAAEATLADNPENGHRYSAACAAALAGCGRGKDADTLDAKEQARLRRQAVAWLRADLAFWTKQTEGDDAKARTVVHQKMKHWQTDADLAGLRDQEDLPKLPEAERDECRQLWDDVAALLKKVETKKE
jgi:serine/threonine-protein kinase